jgi:Aspartyl protease
MKKFVIYITLLLILTSYSNKKTPKSIALIYHNNLYFIKIKLNDKNANLLVDTGAAASLLDINQAEEYNFEAQETEHLFAGVGGTSNRYRVYKYKFHHDSTTLNVYPHGADLKFIVESFSKTGMSITGVLGSDFLRKNNAIIDYRTKTLHLYD